MRDFLGLKALTNMIFGGKSPFWNYLLPRTKFNYQKEVGDGLGSSVVMGPILWITRTFPEAPIALEMDKELVDEHDMLDLIRKPNPFFSGHILAMATIMSFSMQGNAYWLKIRNNQRKVIQLWFVPHWMMEPKWPPEGTEFISHYDYKPTLETFRIEVEDVIHFRYGLDPRNIRKGLSPLGSLFREIFTDDESANFVSSLLRNMGIPGIVIGPGSDDGVIDPKDKSAIKRFYKKNYGGDNRGEPIVMSGKTDIHSFGFSPLELDLSKLRNIPEERVTAILGIPAAVVGFGTGLQQTKVGATMSEMREMAYESCIIPMQQLIASEIENNLLPDFEGENHKYHVVYDNSEVRVLQEDQNKKATRLNTMVGGGWIKVSEARKGMGLDVDLEHEIYLRPFNLVVVPAGRSPEEQELGLVPNVDEGMPDEDKDKDGNGKMKSRFFVPFFGTKESSREVGRQLARQFHKDWLHLSKKFIPELSKRFRDLGRMAAQAWEQVAVDRGIERLASTNKPETKDEVTEDDILTDIIIASMVIIALDHIVPYLRAAKLTYRTIEDVTGIAVDLTIEAELRILAAGGKHLGLVDLTAQTKRAVFQALQEARKLGEDIPAAASRVNQHVSRGRYLTIETRSQVIARTEMKYAQNMGSLEAYRGAGITHVQIVDGQLPTSDDYCIERDGTIIPVEEAEAISLDEHPNGTLSFTPITEGA